MNVEDRPSLASVSQFSTKRSDGAGFHRTAGAGQARADVVGVRRIDAHPGGRRQAQVIGQDALHTTEAVGGIAALRADGEASKAGARLPCFNEAKASRR
jgi:hypothetical protein